MNSSLTQSPPSRLRTAAFAPIGEEGRTEQVVSRIVQAISVGAFTEGERLPSETELSGLLGVAVVTVREALGALRHRGLIETRRGRHGGSFVRSSHGAVEEVNARALAAMPRVALADLGVHYEVIVGACADYACLRATAEELDVVRGLLDAARDLTPELWRRRVTEVQLELAALSQSVRLTNEHVRVQTEFTPLLALQDLDAAARRCTHDALASQIEATRAGDAAAARSVVRESVRGSVRWLVAFRAELLADPRDEVFRATLDSRRADDRSG
ncbi:GntR family transcriptional regulator [Leucobacter sp. UCD-THU]|uniref:FadR family transcriptional regulator n=1 Tax=Leucobacter muris TaxID=1935379 RepID=A0ABX5QIC1_9MICO|nr:MULTISPECIES: GntR family transcriptional regulator [Leucobacter]EYT51841.1 GntR family transcriptional regulator [Leucobacter sp. UCD-THU]QAB18842.1 FadR family transcriptional regulator [Leucobacter muris]